MAIPVYKTLTYRRKTEESGDILRFYETLATGPHHVAEGMSAAVLAALEDKWGPSPVGF